jgi:hypothetical protein
MKNETTINHRTAPDAKHLLSADACPHKKGSVIEIFETNNLPTITGDNTKYYDGFCVDCENMVYGRTGKKVIRWTTDRNYAFGS